MKFVLSNRPSPRSIRRASINNWYWFHWQDKWLSLTENYRLNFYLVYSPCMHFQESCLWGADLGMCLLIEWPESLQPDRTNFRWHYCGQGRSHSSLLLFDAKELLEKRVRVYHCLMPRIKPGTWPLKLMILKMTYNAFRPRSVWSDCPICI